MILCHCEVVSDRAVRDSIENGAQTVADVSRSTGAGRNCGACVFSVKRLLCDHVPVSRPLLPEVEVAAS